MTPSGRKIDVQTYSSPYHMEISPSDMGFGADRIVIQDLIKEFSSTPGISGSRRPFKIAIILEAHCLSRDAQNALRRTMERCSKNVRFIFVADFASSIFAPLKSRCLCLRCPAVDQRAFMSISPNSKSFRESYGSLRRNLLCAQHPNTEIKWESSIDKCTSAIANNPNFQSLISDVRTNFSYVLQLNIPKSDIMKSLLLSFLSMQGKNLNLGLLAQVMSHYVILFNLMM